MSSVMPSVGRLQICGSFDRLVMSSVAPSVKLRNRRDAFGPSGTCSDVRPRCPRPASHRVDSDAFLGRARAHANIRQPPSDLAGSDSPGWFWAVACAFATVMAFTTVPTPLWSLYVQRDGLSSLTVTIVFAVYALAVALSLFMVGHLSD